MQFLCKGVGGGGGGGRWQSTIIVGLVLYRALVISLMLSEDAAI